MIFINTLKANDSYQEIYLIKSVTKNVTTTGKSFLSMILQDKTGTIPAKKWDIDNDDIETFTQGSFVNVSFEVTTYKDKLELRISRGDKVNVTKLDDYIPSSPIPKEELVKKLESYLLEIKDNDIKNIVNNLYKEHKDKYITYPAASNNHHAFASGLLYHTVSMLEVASFLAKHYNDVDKDILLAGVFFHDIGKIKELSGLLPIEYTTEGRLLGHLVIAVNLINNEAIKLKIENKEKVLMLEHVVLASHGKYEFGSPVLPETKEAILLSFIDDLDAKMMMYDINTKELNPGEFTKTLLNFDNRRLYKKK